MQLRKWQSECVKRVLQKYDSGKRHFLCLATPGAGKTTMAAEVAATLLKTDQIDFVLCFSPSVIISSDIQDTLERQTNFRFDGAIGAKGGSYTYQSMQHMSDEIWALLKSHRVFVIFDEIHHCSGSELANANAWGEEIITNIQGDAAYTLALTGTPWRSDKTPIALAEYKDPDNQIVCDYTYGLAEAISDKVCRIPQIVVTDNNDISIDDNTGSNKTYASFLSLLDETPCPYQKIVEHEVVIRHILTKANQQLKSIRIKNPEAGGLVVASSVEHARKILNILQNELNEPAVIATYKEHEPNSVINEFKFSSMPWIVSVGMISEGTNLPRLQVCCHLTRIKTELHFRQILGRVLRVSNADNQDALLFMPAEIRLIEYANRVAEDIPFDNAVVKFDNLKRGLSIDDVENISDSDEGQSDQFNDKAEQIELTVGTSLADLLEMEDKTSVLTQTYEATLDIYGQFHQEVLTLNKSTFERIVQ